MLIVSTPCVCLGTPYQCISVVYLYFIAIDLYTYPSNVVLFLEVILNLSLLQYFIKL